MTSDEQFARNAAGNEAYIQQHYSKENFISVIPQTISLNKYIKGLVIPKNVKVAESRLPISHEQREVLRKELRQAEILAKMGYSVYLIPEHHVHGQGLKDAIVNGTIYEFRTVGGNVSTLEWHFKDVKKRKGADTNLFFNITGNITRNEATHVFGKVLRRKPEYSGKIVISFNEGRDTYFWDSNSLR
ncbi:MAG: hypothetical protein FWD13_06250 [Treponema sp.]|nr:hypothetical protein [Treponema sp.]